MKTPLESLEKLEKVVISAIRKNPDVGIDELQQHCEEALNVEPIRFAPSYAHVVANHNGLKWRGGE
jgi:hypothetical protein